MCKCSFKKKIGYILSSFEVHDKCTFNTMKCTSFSQGLATHYKQQKLLDAVLWIGIVNEKESTAFKTSRGSDRQQLTKRVVWTVTNDLLNYSFYNH